jgi:hypothetical protein
VDAAYDRLAAVLGSGLLASAVLALADADGLPPEAAVALGDAIAGDPGLYDRLLDQSFDWVDDLRRETADVRAGARTPR